MKETEFSVDTPWGKIAGITFGDSSNPPALVVHGKLDVCTSFRPLLNLLPPTFYYVAIDLPGCGRSSHPPPGVRYAVFDLVPTVGYVREHFGWDSFVYIGHSLGTIIGKMYNIAYPGVISRVVELDPVPSHHTWATSREALRSWYHSFYDSYNRERFHKIYGSPENAPRYTYQQAEEVVMKGRGMTKEAASHVLERCLVPVTNDLYRFSYDQRMKEVTVLPYSGELLQRIYTATTTPTFAVLAQDEINQNAYANCDFVMDKKAWPNANYDFKIVDGGHNVHIVNPQCLADDVAKFLKKHHAKL